MSVQLGPIAEDDCAEYEPSEGEEIGDGQNAAEGGLVVEPEEEDSPESEAEAQAIARANQLWAQALGAGSLRAAVAGMPGPENSFPSHAA